VTQSILRPRGMFALFAGLMLVSFLTGPVLATSEPTLPFAHEHSDLTPDPTLVYGKLENGFRYVLQTNQTPPDRVGMHLVVGAGSLNETDAQQGLAHYLEHLLFCGSTHFPPGELIKYFQRIGMKFGNDANAHTGFSETVYDVLLPRGDHQSLQDGLRVMQDYAQGALLLPAEIDRERSVILAEKRTRDSAAYRTFTQTFSFELPDSRLPRRFPIGLESVIQQAQRDAFVDFYDTWYRPANMALVVVGDFDVETVQSLIETDFSQLQPRAPARPAPDIGWVAHTGNAAFYHHEADAGNTSVSIETVRQMPPRSDSAAYLRERILADMADQIVQNRLNNLIEQPDTPFTAAFMGSGIFQGQILFTEINARCSPQNWAKALTLIEHQLRLALEYGFEPAELERVRKQMLADLDNAVKAEPTRETDRMAADIISHLTNDRVLQSAAQSRDLLAPFLRDVTVEMVHQALTTRWSPAHRLVLVTGNARIDSPYPDKQIMAVFESARHVELSAPEAPAEAVFPYLPLPQATGGMLRRSEMADLGITQVAFSNGVILNVKATDFEANQVLVDLNFGAGRSIEPPQMPGLARLAVDVINLSGLGRLTREQLDQALAGKDVSLHLTAGDERFAFKGQTVSDQVELLFQLLQTYLTDPGLRDDGLKLAQKRYHQQYQRLNRSIDGAMALYGMRFLAGGDPRFGLPGAEDVDKLTLADIKSWFLPQLQHGPLEISLVGDLNPGDVICLAGRYLGTLPRRGQDSKWDDPSASAGPHFPVGQTRWARVSTDEPKGLVVMAYPTDDMWDIYRTRRLSLLASVFSEKMRERIREKLGAAYSPFAYNQPSRAYPGYGVFQAFVQIDPSQVEAIEIELAAIADDLSENGVSAELLQRTLDPVLTGIKDMLRENSYWLNTVLAGSSAHPQQLDWNRSIVSDYRSIRAEQLAPLAREYLRNDLAAAFIAVPEN